MKTFAAGEIERFLLAVDRGLLQSSTLILIGGSAAALHHGVTRATLDIDTVFPSPRLTLLGTENPERVG